METWTLTRSTDEAAALATQGAPVRIQRGIAVRSGDESTHFLVGLTNLEGTIKSKRLLTEWGNGALTKSQPAHPMCTIMQAFANRRRILDLANRGTLCSLMRPLIGPARYEPSPEGLAGLSAAVPVIRTGDLKIVAALSVVGLEILHIDGPSGSRMFYVRAMIDHGGQHIDGAALMRSWRSDPESIPWEEPFAQAMRGLCTRERVLDAIRDSAIDVTVMPRHGIKRAIVQADAQGNVSDAAMQRAGRFFHG